MHIAHCTVNNTLLDVCEFSASSLYDLLSAPPKASIDSMQKKPLYKHQIMYCLLCNVHNIFKIFVY